MEVVSTAHETSVPTKPGALSELRLFTACPLSGSLGERAFKAEEHAFTAFSELLKNDRLKELDGCGGR